MTIELKCNVCKYVKIKGGYTTCVAPSACTSHSMWEHKNETQDTVNHPKHYNEGTIECIDAIESATSNLSGLDAICTGNAIKYLWRWKYKNGIEDLKKAIWYINKIIESTEKEE